MKYKFIGNSKLKLSSLGLGCMGMSEFYGTPNDDESEQTIKKAYEFGVNHFDTADVYGLGHNETLLGETIKELNQRNNIIIATKCGLIRNEQGEIVSIDGTKDHIKKSCETSLKRLQTDYIDIYYLHREDPNTPIEISMQAMSELVQEGKIRYIGLSSVGPDTIRRAHKIYPLTAIQSEYSILTRDVEIDILDTCKDLDIGFIAFSPIGNGFLTGKIHSLQQLEGNDLRQIIPRLQPENIDYNLKIVEILKEIGAKKGYTPAQIALAWVQAQSNVIAIPGTRNIKHLEENLISVQVELSQEELSQLNKQIPIGFAKGRNVPKDFARLVNNYEPVIR